MARAPLEVLTSTVTLLTVPADCGETMPVTTKFAAGQLPPLHAAAHASEPQSSSASAHAALTDVLNRMCAPPAEVHTLDCMLLSSQRAGFEPIRPVFWPLRAKLHILFHFAAELASAVGHCFRD